MFKLKSVYSLFILAALFFVAKPFIGFKLKQSLFASSKNTSLLVKVFTKRKPEYFEEANASKATVSAQLNNPPAELLVTLLSLLSILFPLEILIDGNKFLTQRRFQDDSKVYLLTRQLII